MNLDGQPFAAVELRRVEFHMATAITLAAWGIDETIANEFFETIRQFENLLSRFRPNSEISQIADGRLAVSDADPQVREMLTRCEELREETDGDFEHEPRGNSGNINDPVLDPNAYAKGWIIDQACRVLKNADVDKFFINAGGDVLVGNSESGDGWRVGIQHPNQPEALLVVIELRTGAVATSGAYEQGEHIRSTKTSPLNSVTVTGPDLAEADALATAVYAAGATKPEWWHKIDPHFGLATVLADGSLFWSPPTRGTTPQLHLAPDYGQ